MGEAVRRRAWSLAVVLALAATACSGGDEGDDAGGEGDGATTTVAAAGGSFEQRDAVLQLSMAATGVSLVANEISLRALQGGAADYCRSGVAAELEPHRATLAAAADAEVRRRAEVALGDLAAVADACASEKDEASLQQAIQRYDASFGQLRQRLDQLLGTG